MVLNILFIIFVSVPSGDVSELKTTFVFEKRQRQQRSEDLEVIESLDDDLYAEFMAELPILKQVLVGDRKKKTLRVNTSALERHAAPATGAPRGEHGVGRWRRTIRPMWSRPRRKASAGRRGILSGWIDSCPLIISCYACGLNETLLPRSRLCHDMFDSDVGQVRSLARFFRARCFYYDEKRYYDRILPNEVRFPPFVKYKGYKDMGMRLDYFGAYMDGCVKRYVDVGPLYTQRACRGRLQPWRAYKPTHAGHRLSRLEIVARGHSDVCVHSPHASLTPFSRSVSLFVRYHVCVCSYPYCNRSHAHAPSLFVLFSIISYNYLNLRKLRSVMRK